VKKGAYYPEGLGDIEQEQHALRKGLLRVLAGDASIPVAVFQQEFAPLTLVETTIKTPSAVSELSEGRSL
jgi:hypothetical protein